MKKGFVYLTAIVDVYSRKLFGWSISNSLCAQWCKSMLEKAITSHGIAEIVNTDQGTQYASAL